MHMLPPVEFFVTLQGPAVLLEWQCAGQPATLVLARCYSDTQGAPLAPTLILPDMPAATTAEEISAWLREADVFSRDTFACKMSQDVVE